MDIAPYSCADLGTYSRLFPSPRRVCLDLKFDLHSRIPYWFSGAKNGAVLEIMRFAVKTILRPMVFGP